MTVAFMKTSHKRQSSSTTLSQLLILVEGERCHVTQLPKQPYREVHVVVRNCTLQLGCAVDYSPSQPHDRP